MISLALVPAPHLIATFKLDTFVLLPISGFAIVWLSFKLAGSYENRMKLVFVLYVATLVGFWLVAGGFWLNKLQIYNLPAIGSWFRRFGDARNFMVNFESQLFFGKNLVEPQELAKADFWSKWELIAKFYFFVLYPLVLALAIFVRLLVFGRSEKQTGIIALFPWFNKPRN